MDDSEGDYDAYDLSEFSATDFAHIDSTTRREHRDDSDSDSADPDASAHGGCGRVDSETSGSGGPQIAVALERAADESVVVKVAVGGVGTGGGSEDSDDAVGAAQVRNADGSDGGKGKSGRHSFKVANRRSPYEMHRSRGALMSVSDLVGPAWCEVQFDYGLRQGRSLALADRPDSFVSAKGKVIAVEKKVAEVNEKVLEHGRSVHKVLESELHPEQVAITPDTNEEYWAIRLINMLSGLDSLMQQHCCREMPVFGIVQDQPIIGIIDEISLKTIPDPEVEPNPHGKRAPTSTGRTSQRSNKRRELSPSQSHVTDFFTSPSKAKASRSPSPICPMVHELSLKDTKTRRFNSLPSDDDALSSRMQLMLYRHLLSSLLSPTFSLSAFWEKIGVDPFVQFSDEFLLKAGLARETDGTVVLGYPACLDDLADLWRSTIHSLRLKSVSPILEIVYRTQPKRSAAPNLTHVDTLYDFATADREARDIARAIEASLRENGYDPDLERAIAESLRDVTPTEECSAAVVDGGNSIAGTRSPSPRGSEQPPDMPHVRWYARSGEIESASAQSGSVEGARPMGESNTAELGTSGSQVPPSQPESSRVIGRKSFVFDEAAMQAHLRDVLQWWRGERPPRGVDLEHSRRCFSCEYREGCEWREMKAREAQEKYVECKSRQMEGSGDFDAT